PAVRVREFTRVRAAGMVWPAVPSALVTCRPGTAMNPEPAGPPPGDPPNPQPPAGAAPEPAPPPLPEALPADEPPLPHPPAPAREGPDADPRLHVPGHHPQPLPALPPARRGEDRRPRRPGLLPQAVPRARHGRGLRLLGRGVLRPARVRPAGPGAPQVRGGARPRLPVRLRAVHRARAAHLRRPGRGHHRVQPEVPDVLRRVRP